MVPRLEVGGHATENAAADHRSAEQVVPLLIEQVGHGGVDSEGVVDPIARAQVDRLARGDLASLARQYARYGYWKARMLLRYPSSLRWRQALPPAFLLSLFVLLVVSIGWPPARLLLGAQVMVYGLVTILAGGLEALRGRSLGPILSVPLAFWTMHLAWGGAFLYSLAITGLRGNRG